MLLQRVTENYKIWVPVSMNILFGVASAVGLTGNIPILSERLPALSLLLLATITGIMAKDISDRERKLQELTDTFVNRTNELETTVKTTSSELLDQAGRVESQIFYRADDGLRYVTRCYRNARKSIDHVALGRYPAAQGSAWEEYKKAVESVAVDPLVQY